MVRVNDVLSSSSNWDCLIDQSSKNTIHPHHFNYSLSKAPSLPVVLRRKTFIVINYGRRIAVHRRLLIKGVQIYVVSFYRLIVQEFSELGLQSCEGGSLRGVGVPAGVHRAVQLRLAVRGALQSVAFCYCRQHFAP